MSEERLNLGLRAVNAPGKQPGSGCGCGHHQSDNTSAVGGCGGHTSQENRHGGCGCGGQGRRRAQVMQPASDLRSQAAVEAVKAAMAAGIDVKNFAAAADLDQ